MERELSLLEKYKADEARKPLQFFFQKFKRINLEKDF